MTGQTPILKLPFVQGGDHPQAYPGVSEALAEGIEKSAFSAVQTAAAAITVYPLGVSVMPLTTADSGAGGWPEGASATVLTVRRQNGDQSQQFLLRSSSTLSTADVRYRAGTSASGWGPWLTIASKRTARAQHAGSYTFDASSVNKSKAIVFPAGQFETEPFVVVSASTRDCVMTATSVTKDGFQLNMGPEEGASSIARRGTWHALEMNGAE